MKRRIAFILALALLVIFTVTACAKKEDDDDGDNEWELSTEGGRKSEPDDLPDDINLKGYKFTVFYRQGDGIKLYECDGDDVESEGVNAIYESVYLRNERVKARLKCDIKWIPSTSGGLSETKTEIGQILRRMEYYDLILSTNNTQIALGENSMLCELSSTPYLDFSKPWWWEDVMRELSFNGEDIHFLVGDMNLVNITKMSAFYFNFKLVEQYLRMTPEDMYNMVDEKKWTIEKLRTLSNNLWIDTGANPNEIGKKDQGDIFAFPYVSGETVNQFVYSTRIADQLYTRRENGLVNFDWRGNQDMEDVVTELRKLIHNTGGAWNRSPKSGQASPYDSGIIKEFSEGHYVFLPQRLTAATTAYMMAMEDDYGIIPYPTLTAGDDYYSYIQDSSTSMCVPLVVRVTSEDNLDRVSMMLEAICAESYRYVTETFYEAALKGRYARDDNAARMIDLIYNTAHKSFICEYSSVAKGIAGRFYTAIWADKALAGYLDEEMDGAKNTLNAWIADLIKKQ